jgi:hypothetical protein
MSKREQQHKKILALITEYQESKITQKTFSQQKQIPLSTFQLWLKKYRHQNQKPLISSDPAKSFIPITIPTISNQLENITGCTIEYPNGIIIRFAGPVDISLLSQLVQVQGR